MQLRIVDLEKERISIPQSQELSHRALIHPHSGWSQIKHEKFSTFVLVFTLRESLEYEVQDSRCWSRQGAVRLHCDELKHLLLCELVALMGLQ